MAWRDVSSCASRNPGCFGPATVFQWSRLAPGAMDSSYVLHSRLRGNHTAGLARQGGLVGRGDVWSAFLCGPKARTPRGPLTRLRSAPPASPAGGEGYWIPAYAGMTRNDTVASSPGQRALAGLSHEGRGGLVHSAKVATDIILAFFRREKSRAAPRLIAPRINSAQVLGSGTEPKNITSPNQVHS